MREVKPGISSEPRLALDLELDLFSVIVDRQVLIGSVLPSCSHRGRRILTLLFLFFICVGLKDFLHSTAERATKLLSIIPDSV